MPLRRAFPVLFGLLLATRVLAPQPSLASGFTQTWSVAGWTNLSDIGNSDADAQPEVLFASNTDNHLAIFDGLTGAIQQEFPQFTADNCDFRPRRHRRRRPGRALLPATDGAVVHRLSLERFGLRPAVLAHRRDRHLAPRARSRLRGVRHRGDGQQRRSRARSGGLDPLPRVDRHRGLVGRSRRSLPRRPT